MKTVTQEFFIMQHWQIMYGSWKSGEFERKNAHEDKVRANDITCSIYLYGSAIMFIIFWNFLMAEQIFFSPQMKRSVIICNKLVYTSCLTSCKTTYRI